MQDKGRKLRWDIQNTQHDRTRISRKRVGEMDREKNISEIIHSSHPHSSRRYDFCLATARSFSPNLAGFPSRSRLRLVVLPWNSALNAVLDRLSATSPVLRYYLFSSLGGLEISRDLIPSHFPPARRP